MSVPVSDRQPVVPARPLKQRRWLVPSIFAGLAAVLAFAYFTLIGSGNGLFHPNGRSAPSFPSLAQYPDSTLHGTVAYYDNASGCIRLVSASGQPSKNLMCLSRDDLSVSPQKGKHAGPQLVWRPDGRLEVTLYSWAPWSGKAPTYTVDWQKLVDPRNGAVQNVPATQVSSTFNTTSEPTVNASNQQVSYSFDASSGRVKVTLTSSGSSRTLLSLRGPGEYTYRFGPVFWEPNGQWIAAGDDGGRILIIVPSNPVVTRILVTDSGGGAGGGTAGPAFAVSAADLLGAGK